MRGQIPKRYSDDLSATEYRHWSRMADIDTARWDRRVIADLGVEF